ncbi:MAG TPA: hypothetical protein VFP72_08355, partial [Kineosporiaceae bacterium]|nr:hypothetical protein [Kineosporiaceae bacterium]
MAATRDNAQSGQTGGNGFGAGASRLTGGTHGAGGVVWGPVMADLVATAARPGFEAWAAGVARIGGCPHP